MSDSKDVIRENLYVAGDKVWVSEESCYATVTKVRRSLGPALHRYDIVHDDGEEHKYVEEDQLYPSEEAEDLDKQICELQENNRG